MHVKATRYKGKKAQQTGKLHLRQLFFSKERRAALDGIRTHDSLKSRRALYQLSYQGNSAGRGSNLQQNTITRQTSNYCAMVYTALTKSIVLLYYACHVRCLAVFKWKIHTLSVVN